MEMKTERKTGRDTDSRHSQKDRVNSLLEKPKIIWLLPERPCGSSQGERGGVEQRSLLLCSSAAEDKSVPGRGQGQGPALHIYGQGPGMGLELHTLLLFN